MKEVNRDAEGGGGLLGIDMSQHTTYSTYLKEYKEKGGRSVGSNGA